MTTKKPSTRKKPAAASIKPVKPWIKSYPPGVPDEIGDLEHSSINALLEKSCDEFNSLPAYSCMGKSLTYGEVKELSDIVVAWLQAKGIQKGDRVAIMMPNILQYPPVMMGILRAGCVVVNVN
ncbi:MAG: AMP-binding protein, partial [Rhizobiaceae bacterium]